MRKLVILFHNRDTVMVEGVKYVVSTVKWTDGIICETMVFRGGDSVYEKRWPDTATAEDLAAHHARTIAALKDGTLAMVEPDGAGPSLDDDDEEGDG